MLATILRDAVGIRMLVSQGSLAGSVGHCPAQNRGTEPILLVGHYLRRYSLSRHEVVVHQVSSLVVSWLAEAGFRTVLYGSVYGSNVSTRRFCRFCGSGIYAPSAPRARSRTRPRIRICASTVSPERWHHRTEPVM